MIDFTNCKRIIGKAYSGANGKKISIEYDNKQYMLKFPASGNNKPTNLSYTNSCISEHIGSTIFNMLGVKAQKTILGMYIVGGKKKIVCACEDFVTNKYQLYDFCAIKNSIIDSEHGGTGTELFDILDTIYQQNFLDSKFLAEHFWNMFVVDAFLGNFDRHNGNWGFLVDIKTQEISIAPIYDCGSCLLPQADDKLMINIMSNNDELNKRIYQFPTSIIKLNDKKINYFEFLNSCEYEDFKKAIKNIVPRINMKEINNFIDSIEGTSDVQRQFYKTYLNARYEKILLPAYKKYSNNQSDKMP